MAANSEDYEVVRDKDLEKTDSQITDAVHVRSRHSRLRAAAKARCPFFISVLLRWAVRMLP